MTRRGALAHGLALALLALAAVGCGQGGCGGDNNNNADTSRPNCGRGTHIVGDHCEADRQ